MSSKPHPLQSPTPAQERKHKETLRKKLADLKDGTVAIADLVKGIVDGSLFKC